MTQPHPHDSFRPRPQHVGSPNTSSSIGPTTDATIFDVCAQHRTGRRPPTPPGKDRNEGHPGSSSNIKTGFPHLLQTPPIALAALNRAPIQSPPDSKPTPKYVHQSIDSQSPVLYSQNAV